MEKDWKKIFDKCDVNPPVSDEKLADFEKSVGKKLPEKYLELLRFCDGLEGPTGDMGYTAVWSTAEVVELNSAYKVGEFAPGMLLIGSDGADQALGIDLREGSQTYGHFYHTHFIGLSWKEAKDLGTEIENIAFF